MTGNAESRFDTCLLVSPDRQSPGHGGGRNYRRIWNRSLECMCCVRELRHPEITREAGRSSANSSSKPVGCGRAHYRPRLRHEPTLPRCISVPGQDSTLKQTFQFERCHHQYAPPAPRPPLGEETDADPRLAPSAIRTLGRSPGHQCYRRPGSAPAPHPALSRRALVHGRQVVHWVITGSLSPKT